MPFLQGKKNGSRIQVAESAFISKNEMNSMIHLKEIFDFSFLLTVLFIEWEESNTLKGINVL